METLTGSVPAERTDLSKTRMPLAKVFKSMGGENVRQGRLYQLRQSVNWKAFDYYPSLNRIRDYGAKNFSHGISLSRAASVAGLEKKYFSRFFKDKVGITFFAVETVSPDQ